MSDRNPLSILRGTINKLALRAYNAEGLRDTDEIVDFVSDRVREQTGANITDLIVKAYVRKTISNRFEQTDFEGPPDLFHDLDYQFTFKRGGRSVQRALRDIELADIDTLTSRKKANIEAAQAALSDWRNAVSVVRPVMEAGNAKTWGEAVQWLERNGKLPRE